MTPMTVADLIEFLKTQQQELPVAYRVFSEQSLMASAQVRVVPLCAPRPDGWIADARPDKPTQNYLLFPGN